MASRDAAQQLIDETFDRLRATPPMHLNLSAHGSLLLSRAFLPGELCLIRRAVADRAAPTCTHSRQCMGQLLQQCDFSRFSLARRSSLWSRFASTAPPSLAESHMASVANSQQHVLFAGDSVMRGIYNSATCETQRAVAAGRQVLAHRQYARQLFVEITYGKEEELKALEHHLKQMCAGGGGLVVAAIGLHFGDDAQMRGYFVSKNVSLTSARRALASTGRSVGYCGCSTRLLRQRSAQ